MPVVARGEPFGGGGSAHGWQEGWDFDVICKGLAKRVG